MCVSVFLWIRCFEISIPASVAIFVSVDRAEPVVCSCRVRGALCELVLGVVVPVLLLLFTSAAARAGGALSWLLTGLCACRAGAVAVAVSPSWRWL